MFTTPARLTAPQVTVPGRPDRVLDIAAGHGFFGIHVGLHNPAAEITFQDWQNVLEVAEENAVKMGLKGRFHTIPGSAFEVDFGRDYDVVLLPNFLHHFDIPTNLGLLKRVRSALKAGGLVAIIEFVPNEDRVTPPDGALFAMRMLGTTPSGDAYTFAEIANMLRQTGFADAQARSLAPAHQQLILARAA
jgi:ubiquinone/menaquinone biosynthesis C-methylase UbiE